MRNASLKFPRFTPAVRWMCALLGLLVAGSACDGGSGAGERPPAMEAEVPPESTLLTQGKEITLSGTSGGELYFAMQVPAGQGELKITLTNAAKVDLYVRRGSRATTTRYDCKSATTASTEECLINAPQEGMWLITVRGTAAYTGVELRGSYSPFPDAPVTALTGGESVTGISLPAGGARFFSLEVPPAQARLAFELSGGTGEPILFSSFGGRPTDISFGCRNTRRGSGTSCSFIEPRAGTWYVMIRAQAALSDVTLTGSYGATVDRSSTALVGNQWSDAIASSPLQDRYFTVEVPSNQVKFVLEVSGGTGEADVYLKRGSQPTPTDNQCIPTVTAPCVYDRPQGGTWHVLVRALTTFSNVKLRPTLTDTVPLVPDAPAEPVSGIRSEIRYFRVEVPEGVKGLRFESPSHPDVYMMAAREVLPDYWYTSLCRDVDYCNFLRPQAGTWFVALSFTAAASSSVRVVFEDGEPLPLVDGVPARVAAAKGSLRYFKFEVPPGQSRLSFDVVGLRSSWLYVKAGTEPTTFDYDSRAYTQPTRQGVGLSFANPAAGTWYALVSADDDIDGAIRATASNLPALVDGTPEPPLSGAQNSERLYTLQVPPGMSDLLVTLTGGTGDTALLVKREGIPNSASNDCKSDNPESSIETCALVLPQAGTWYILVRGKQAYSGVVLNAQAVPAPGDAVQALENDVALANLSEPRYSYRLWKLEVPEGQARLEFNLSGGTGNADLLVQHATRPSATSFLCQSNGTANTERCVFENPQAGTWFALVRGGSSFRSVWLTGRYSLGNEVVTLTNGIPFPNLALSGTAKRLFKVEVPAGQSGLRFHLRGSFQSASMFVKKDSPPAASDAPCASRGTSSLSLVCDKTAEAGTWYVQLQGGFSGAALTAHAAPFYLSEPATPLTNGVPELNLSSSTERQFFVLQVPPGASRLQFTTRGQPASSTASLSLYVKRAGDPSSSPDCSSVNAGSEETCSFTNPEPGQWFVLVRGTQYSNVDLLGLYE
ncbi:PPC domain-containing protein [Archangium violaceum]|uniref:PPC domain-containing protein n=1 Tax=Archangium violaceum TaxID=83451 RepID=UPI0036DF755A